MGLLFGRSIGCGLHGALQNFMPLFIFPCAGKAGMSRLYLSNPCALLLFCTRCCGRSQRPAFPVPFFRRGTTNCKTRAKSSRENEGACPSTSLRAKRSNPASFAAPRKLYCFVAEPVIGRAFA